MSREFRVRQLKEKKIFYGKSSRKLTCVALALASVLAASCDNRPASEPVLRASFSLAESEWKIFREEIFPPFEKQNHCKIEAVQVDSADLPKLLQVGKQSGKTRVDLFAQDNMELALLVRKDLVEDLTPYAEDLAKEIYPSLMEAGRFDGRMLFIPFRPNVQIFYYNRDKFKEYGLRPPQSWDEWLKCGQVFYEKEKVGRILITGFGGSATVTQIYEYIAAAGGDPFSFNDEGSKKTFLFFQKLWRVASPDSRKAKWDTSNDYFAQNAVYLMQNWPFGYKIITEDYGKTGVGVYRGFPGPVREAHVVGGDVFGIPKGTRNRDLSLQFIRYLLSREVQDILVQKLSWPSARPDANKRAASPALHAVEQALKFGIFRKNVTYWAQYQKLFEEAFVRVVMKGEDISVLDSFHTRMKKIQASYE